MKLEGYKTVVLAFCIVVGARFILEPSLCIPIIIAQRFGHQVNHWLMQFFTTGLGFVQFYYFRKIIDGMRVKRAILSWIICFGVFILLGIGLNQSAFAKNMNGPPPLPKDLGNINIGFKRDINLNDKENVIFSWVSQKNESLVEIGPYMDGIEHEGKLLFELKDIKFKEDLKEILCSVELDNTDGIIKDGNPSLEIGIVKSNDEKYAELLKSTKFKDITKDNISFIFVLSKIERTELSSSDDIILFLKFGIHSGGDYTQPDKIKVKMVKLTFNYGT